MYFAATLIALGLLSSSAQAVTYDCPADYQTLMVCDGQSAPRRDADGEWRINVSLQLCKKGDALFLGLLDSGMHADRPVLNSATSLSDGGVTTITSYYRDKRVSGELRITESAHSSFSQGTFTNGPYYNNDYLANVRCLKK